MESNGDEDWVIIKLPQIRKEPSFSFGNTQGIGRGSKVVLLGFSNYGTGNKYSVNECNVTSNGNDVYSYRHKICTVDSTIIHGASGGPVLNSSGKVVGIITAGVNSTLEAAKSGVSGFIFIDIVKQAIVKQIVNR